MSSKKLKLEGISQRINFYSDGLLFMWPWITAAALAFFLFTTEQGAQLLEIIPDESDVAPWAFYPLTYRPTHVVKAEEERS